MDDRLRHLAIYVVEPRPKVFRWNLVELHDGRVVAATIATGGDYTQWCDAWDSGCVAMHRLVEDERIGPRATLLKSDRRSGG